MHPFRELLLVSIGKRDGLNRCLSTDEWQNIFSMAKKQAILGITFKGVERLSKDQRPPRNLLLNWIYVADKTRSKNVLIRKRAIHEINLLSEAGFRTCLLKGVGLLSLYEDGDLSYLRASGDIDLWVEGKRLVVYDYLRKHYRLGDMVYHHIDTCMFADVKTEIHFWPTFSFSPRRNARLRKWFTEQAPIQFQNKTNDELVCPDVAFNAVYLLLHIFRHMFEEGVGIRHFMDYYFLLRHLSDEERKEAMKTLRWMGLGKFTAAAMYVVKALFCDEENPDDKLELLCEPDDKLGAFLLNEVVQAGNFGHFDERLAASRNRGQLSRWKSFERLVSVFRLSPSEVLCAPFWKLWHWCWRKINFK
ncbi:MAG: nucleotidyltransferase family protein [Candidatus Cryptobacteroides sp.]|nr:nucleotidyltransferase family protein [Candidatus Cryptobacteroides sp.]